MRKVFIIFTILIFGCSGKENKQEEVSEYKEPKSVTISRFTFPEFSDNSREVIEGWRELKSIFQVLASISPQDNSTQKILNYGNPDSLFLVKRFFINSSMRENISSGMDWREDSSVDTIFFAKKDDKKKVGSLYWDEVFYKDVPYTISFKVRLNTLKYVSFVVYREKDRKNVIDCSIVSDSTSVIKCENVKTKRLSNNWLEVKANVKSPLTLKHKISINIDDMQENEDFSTYNLEGYIPVKYLPEMNKVNDNVLIGKEIRSSYNGLYYWLTQIQDEMKIMWDRDNIPEKLDILSVKSRLKLFETYVKELRDNVKNNPNLTEEEVKESLYKIRDSFSDFINYTNIICGDDIDKKVEDFTRG